jgi:hypothetical protein
MADEPPPTPKRAQQFNLRIDPELYAAAMGKAAPHGLGTIIRALLRAFVRGDVRLPADDLLRETAAAPRGRPGKPRRKTRKRKAE